MLAGLGSLLLALSPGAFLFLPGSYASLVVVGHRTAVDVGMAATHVDHALEPEHVTIVPRQDHLLAFEVDPVFSRRAGVLELQAAVAPRARGDHRGRVQGADRVELEAVQTRDDA